MNIDKKTGVLVGGAFIVGGLTVAAIGMIGGHGRGFDHDRNYEKGGMHNMMNDRDDNSRYQKGAEGNRDYDMMGMDHSGMDMDSMMVENEQDFILGMIPHHEEAVTTAKQVLERGGSTPEIKTLAQNIVTAQEKEVAEMKTWYKSWYGKDYVADGKYQPMMRPLESLSGAELDKVFLTDMIMHHNMAIMMAGSVSAHIEHPEMTTLVGNIKTTQSTEIETMRNLLKTLN